MARKQFQSLFKEVYTSAVAVDPASIAGGAELSGTITVTGASVGDMVMVAPGVDLQTLLLSASVISANTVEWVLLNETAGAIDLASSTWNVVVLHPDFNN
jgi:hypothetical protein